NEQGAAQKTALQLAMQDSLKARLGVAIKVQLVAPGATAPLTGIEARQKPIRLIDERHA
ncbi:MAG: phenylacetate-CoA ligase, partial [Gammaproteobacteria bacterium]